MRLIGQAHTMLHQKGIVRIQTDIRVGSRYVLCSAVRHELVRYILPLFAEASINLVVRRHHADGSLSGLTRSKHSAIR